MKNSYNARDLYIGKLVYFPEEFNPKGITGEITEQKYFFEKKNDKLYKEIFTGETFQPESIRYFEGTCYMYFDEKYVIELEDYTSYYPLEEEKCVKKSDILMKLNEINRKEQPKIYKKI